MKLSVLSGLRGSGRTEILKGIAGIDPADGGWVVIGGRRLHFSSPHQALGNGVVYLPEDREVEGLISDSSIRENLTLNALRQISRGGLIDRRKESGLVGTLVDMLQIKAASPEQEVRQLSGGNRQKVVIGRILPARPRVFLLDEPTKGIGIAAKESILNIVKNRLSESAGIVITSPGLEDHIMVCDRILVLCNGRIIAEFTRGSSSQAFCAHSGSLRKVEVPVMVTGGIKQATFADRIIRQGLADLVGIGRALSNEDEILDVAA